MSTMLSIAFALLLSSVSDAAAEAGETKVDVEITLEQPAAKCGDVSLALEAARETEQDPAQRTRWSRSVQEARTSQDPRVRLQLAAGYWQLSVETQRCWAPTETLRVEEGHPTGLTIPLWPSGRLSGRIVTATASVMPHHLRVHFEPASTDAKSSNVKAEGPTGTILCPIVRNAIACDLPITRLNLRLSARGFAPVYAWSIEPSAAGVRIGPIMLRPGASVSGFIATQDGADLPPETEAVVLPRGLAQAPQDGIHGQQTGFARHEGRIEPSGFFQVTGLPPGEQMLRVRAPAYATAEVAFHTAEGLESQLRDPVELPVPLVARIFMQPPVSPEGEMWRLSLSRIDVYHQSLSTLVDAARVAANGWFEQSGIPSGKYLLKIIDQDGNSWYGEEVELREDVMPLGVELSALRVHGRVLLGDRPLRATVWFGGRSGATKIRAQSDEEGSFSTLLPHSGEWMVDVDVASPHIRRRFAKVLVAVQRAEHEARVELRLPDNVLRGTVTLADGSTPRFAIIAIEPTGSSLAYPTDVTVSKSSSFESHGLLPGPAEVYAEWTDLRSQAVKLEIPEEGEVGGIHLVLRKSQSFTGRVTTGGLGLPGAKVLVAPFGAAYAMGAFKYTDARGVYESTVPPNISRVQITISALGSVLDTEIASVPASGGILETQLRAPGGTLRIERERLVPIKEKAPYSLLMKDGIPVPMISLVDWQRVHPRSQVPGLVVLPNMAAGQYRFCLTPREDARGQAASSLPPRCDEGTLVPNGDLLLTASNE